jgi:hypothetical protein
VYRRWLTVSLCCVCLVWIFLGCTPQEGRDDASGLPPSSSQVPPPTPVTDTLRSSGTSTSGARLRVTVPSIKLLKAQPGTDAQLILVLADAQGTYSYLVYPANRAGDSTDTFDLTSSPLELTLSDGTSAVALWIVAVHNTRYYAAEMFGLDPLAASLGNGMSDWLAGGNRMDDPLAAVVSASRGALYEWFAQAEVLGESMITLKRQDNWDIGLDSQRSPDGGLNLVYTVQYISAADVALIPTSTPMGERTGYALVVDETFEDSATPGPWYQGEDNTYVNRVVKGAYEIRLTNLVQRDFGLSWGSLEGQKFENYIIEARVRLVEDNVADARYGIWFNYQDDSNFIYFGISNTGEYRVAVVVRNSNRVEIQDWTPHPAILRGAATNTLTIEAYPGGTYTLSVNGKQLLTFKDQTFNGGSIAFFCYAESVPATCRLEHLRVWEPVR